MFFSRFFKPSYASVHSIESSDYEDEESKHGVQAPVMLRPTGMTIKIGLCHAIILAVLFCTSIVSTWVLLLKNPNQINLTNPPVKTQWQCAQPSVRREWRSLVPVEKKQYIEAVQCLETKPSRLRNNGTLYDDFPWVHKLTSVQTHKSPAFLAWHRYFLHVYERALIDDCAYAGSLPYWDWSLDWQDFTKAPVWGDDAFGSNGPLDGELSVGDGHCVVDGPFAGLQAMFYDDEYHPHCLSRGFQSGTIKEALGKLVQPESIAQIMEEDDYESFALQIEHNAHKFMSESVRGEFSRFTGPYDPVFFLHHTNIDRIWWQWQMKNPDMNLHAYSGKASKIDIREATLEDNLDLAGLRHIIPVSEVMDTTSGLFCYQY